MYYNKVLLRKGFFYYLVPVELWLFTLAIFLYPYSPAHGAKNNF